MLDSTLRRALALGLLASPGLADVLILEAPGLGAIRDPQAAVDMAPEGATLVFGGEEIGGFTINGKSLTLVGSEQEDFAIVGQVVVRNLAEGQSVRAQGLRVRPAAAGLDMVASRVLVINCDGAVRFSGCSIEGRDGSGSDFSFEDGEGAVLIQGSSDVAWLDSTIQGGDGGGAFNTFCCTGGAGGTALTMNASEVALYDCTVAGGSGGTAGIWGGGGGAAVVSADTRLFSSGSSMQGGAGGGADDVVAVTAGDGGAGIAAFGLPKPRLLATQTAGGPGGSSVVGSDGAAGAARVWDQGALTPVPGSHRGLRAVQTIALLGSTLSLELEGLAGDRFFLAASMLDARTQKLVPPGVRLLPNPLLQMTAPIATLSASGTQTVSLAAPGIPGGQDQATWILQAFVVDAQGGKALSGAVLVTSMRPDVGLDCNGNAVWDVADALLGAVDCDGNLELDACQTLPDCNANGIADGLEIDCFGANDINDNGVLDSCEGLTTTVYVNPSAAAGGDGTFSAPFRNISQALPAVSGGGSILLFDGVYAGPLNRGIITNGLELTIESVFGPAFCRIDLENAGAFVLSGFQTNAPLLTLRGLTVENGFADNFGGAVREPSRPVLIEDCVFQGNSALRTGGAVHAGPGSRILRSTFVANATDPVAAFSGGGAVYAQPPLVVSDCIFDDNFSREGGAIQVDGEQCGEPSFIGHSVFRGNESSDNGGALHLAGCFSATSGELITIDNCFGALNKASKSGGFLFMDSGVGRAITRLSSCTLVFNEATSNTSNQMGGGAIWIGTDRQLEISNSILSQNTAGSGPQVRGVTGNQVIVDHSNVVGGAASIVLPVGTVSFLPSSLDVDPGFMPQAGDYRLAAGSPCIDAGSAFLLSLDAGDINGDGFLQEEAPVDLLGQARRNDDPGAPDVGTGRNPLPDMGAFER